MKIMSNFYFVLICYFREISDLIDIFYAGEHPIPVESRFDEEKGETEPVTGVFVGLVPPGSIRAGIFRRP